MPTDAFKYDPFGRRICKSSLSGTSVFAYDGDNLVEETNAVGVAVARYSQTQNIDEPLAILRSGATSHYHADGLGSVTPLSSAAPLELRGLSRGVSQVKDFHEALVFAELVVHENGAMREFTHSRPLADGAAHAGKASQQFDVIEQAIAEARGGLTIFFGNVADDFSEIGSRSLREEEVEIHLGSSSRTRSTETVRPALASRMPSSIAARVASFSSSMTGAGFSKSNSLALAMGLC